MRPTRRCDAWGSSIHTEGQRTEVSVVFHAPGWYHTKSVLRPVERKDTEARYTIPPLLTSTSLASRVLYRPEYGVRGYELTVWISSGPGMYCGRSNLCGRRLQPSHEKSRPQRRGKSDEGRAMREGR
jgi:hypothetical protein